MNGTQITLTGLVATTPRPAEGLAIFRLVEHRDEARSNWYTIRAYGQLAENVLTSIEKGQHVTLTGRLEVVDWDNGEKTGTSVEVFAEAIGHNLAYGISTHTPDKDWNKADQ